MGARATATKASLLLAVGLGFCALGCDGSAPESGRASTTRKAFPESSRAALRVAELAKEFPVLGATSAARFRQIESGRARAELRGDVTASVTLPAAIDGWVELEDGRSRLGIRFARIGAGTAQLGVSSGLAVYSSTEAPVDDIHRVLPAGVEDFVALAERPAVETLSYRVEVTRVSGLRLVGGTLEFLDSSGAPRLRVAPPYFMAPGGQRHAASLAVDGCHLDTDPRAPWGRPTVAPGATTCVVNVRWKADDYPILVDPLWTTTDDMAEGRTQMRAAARLPSGRVLVTAGTDGTSPLASAEIYDPEMGMFAAALPMSVSRGSPGISALASGKILVTGGWNGGPCCPDSSWRNTAEVYDEDTGQWTATAGPMSAPRELQSQTLLPSGQVLIAGGRAGSFWQSAELFDPATTTFDPAADLSYGIRALHTGTLLSDGTVLIAGGENTGTAEIYDPATDQFTRTDSMSTNRGQHAAVSLGGGKALVVGGWDGTVGTDMPLNTAEIYDADTKRFTATGTMAKARRWPTATRLDSGQVLVVGGSEDSSVGLTSAELFDPTAGMFTSAMTMSVARIDHAATLLLNGSVLVMGGKPNTSTPTAHKSASLYLYKSNGTSCADGNECRSTFCVEQVCCEESACTGTCVTGVCVDGTPGAGGEASGGSSGSAGGGRGGANPTGGTGGSAGAGTTSGGSAGTGADDSGGETGNTSGTGGAAPGGGTGNLSGTGGDGPGGDTGNVCSSDSDCSSETYCDGAVCVPRTPLESACGCRIPGRRVPNGALLAYALVGGGGVLRRRGRRARER